MDITNINTIATARVSQGKVLLLIMLRSFSYVLPSVSIQNPGKTTGKYAFHQFTKGYYMQYVSTHGKLVNGLHTPKLWCSRSLNEKPHVMDLKLIDVINVSYMFL